MGWSPFRKTGLTHHTPAQTVKGYTLVTPVNGDSTYLIDMAGRIAQRWHDLGLPGEIPEVRAFEIASKAVYHELGGFEPGAKRKKKA